MLRIPKNTYIYSRPSRSLTDSAPTTDRKTATEDGEHAEITLESSPRSENSGNQQKTALYIALADACRLFTAENITESTRNKPLTFSNKNVKKLYKVTFFEILAFFAEILTTSKNNHCNRSKNSQTISRTAATADSTPDPETLKGVNGKI